MHDIELYNVKESEECFEGYNNTFYVLAAIVLRLHVLDFIQVEVLYVRQFASCVWHCVFIVGCVRS
jgi:hypothetical protein